MQPETSLTGSAESNSPRLTVRVNSLQFSSEIHFTDRGEDQTWRRETIWRGCPGVASRLIALVADISREACKPFGFNSGDRVLTPHGPAWVVGVHLSDLYYQIDGDRGASKVRNP